MPVIESRLQIPSEMIIHETEHWVINHNFASALPGYLILGSKAPVDSLADLAPAALHEFGELLALPGYPIHFHLIPVYPWIEKLFWEDRRYRLLDTFANRQNAETRTDGAELNLFIWREFGERAQPPAIEGLSIPEVVERLRAAITGRD